MDDLRDIPVGSDRFRAQTIAEACRAAGFKVQVFFADDAGYGALQSHRLLVRAEDYAKVLKIVRRSDNPREARRHAARLHPKQVQRPSG